MQNPAPAQPGKSSTGLDENIAALLAYVFGWISGLIFFLIEKDSKLVRFHAMQALLLNICIVVLCVALWIITFVLVLIASQLADIMGTLVGLLATLIWLALSVGILIAWVLCLVRAYQGKYFKLPIIGNLAEKIANK
jgi:uncharacterized membrane protein